jgi:hypothetical protein
LIIKGSSILKFNNLFVKSFDQSFNSWREDHNFSKASPSPSTLAKEIWTTMEEATTRRPTTTTAKVMAIARTTMTEATRTLKEKATKSSVAESTPRPTMKRGSSAASQSPAQ